MKTEGTKKGTEGETKKEKRTKTGYVELHCKSNFSFLRGASHPDELVERAVALEYHALAITDVHTLAGVVRMYSAAKAGKLTLIVGAEIHPTDALPVVLYATDRAAYGRLSRLITCGRLRMPKGDCAVHFDDIAELSEGLIAMVLPSFSLHTSLSSLRAYRDVFADRLYMAAEIHVGHHDERRLAQLAQLARHSRVPMVAANDVHYHEPQRRFLQDVVTCIREHCAISEAGARLFANAERYLKSPEQMLRLFHAYPKAIARTVEIADCCAFSLDELRYEYPEELCPVDQTPIRYLAELTWQGARERFPNGLRDKVRTLIEHELRLIEELSYESYFLTVWDLVRFARSQGILCQGRGSAANSAVCYCLGITNVDPDRIDLLFERFVSKERNEPPDIDVDFEHERREEVFQYIYKKYGREHAGIVAEVITYRPRSAIRDVGKVLGLSVDRVDLLAKKLDWWGNSPLPTDSLVEAGLDPNDRTIRLLVTLVEQIVGFPRHLSQHVGGFVITRHPLCELVPIQNAAMVGRTFIEWDKDDIDALGILKVDCLALGMLSAIGKCFSLIRRHEGINRGSITEDQLGDDDENRDVSGCACSIERDDGSESHLPGDGEYAGHEDVHPCDADDSIRTSGLNPPFEASGVTSSLSLPPCLSLHSIPPEDPAVYDMICKADTVGVFQIESRAQMSMLPRLKPRNFYDLVIEVAIVRPGPIQGCMVHPYLRRRNGEERITFPNAALEQVLRKTLGIPLFQEQAMRLAIVAAGFTPGEADQLRRAMGAWRRRGKIDGLRNKLVGGMMANGLSEEFAQRCFEQISGFGEYGFPESHAASFALLVYVSAWLKRYHPAAFAAALINSQPMGFYAPAQLVRDAIEHGVEVRRIDVNASGYDCSLEERHEGRDEKEYKWGTNGPALRLGMRLVKGVSDISVTGIEKARKDGPFASVYDLARRSGVRRRVLARLATADAFRSMGLCRREAVWQALAVDEDELPLFEGLELHEEQSRLPDMTLEEHVITDYDTFGLSLTAHPISLLRRELDRVNIVQSETLKRMRHGQSVRVAGLVLVRQRPSTASGIVFYTLEDETGVANLIVRPAVYERCRRAGRNSVALIACGRIARQGDVVHVQVSHLEHLADGAIPTRIRARHFH